MWRQVSRSRICHRWPHIPPRHSRRWRHMTSRYPTTTWYPPMTGRRRSHMVVLKNNSLCICIIVHVTVGHYYLSKASHIVFVCINLLPVIYAWLNYWRAWWRCRMCPPKNLVGSAVTKLAASKKTRRLFHISRTLKLKFLQPLVVLDFFSSADWVNGITGQKLSVSVSLCLSVC